MSTRILFKTTIGSVPDDWSVSRFSLLTDHLRGLTDSGGQALYHVVARDRIESRAGDDVDLQELASGAYDQLWLVAADQSGALSARDAESIAAFRQGGGGILLTRDHQDLGACLIRLGALGATQFFQTVNPDPDESRRCRDDTETVSISWPNFHSGANGDLQTVAAVEPVHALMKRGSVTIRRLPAHPHEGAVGIPAALRDSARVIAQGRSKTTGALFNVCVAVEQPGMGRVVSDSSFHHFCDYNWDPRMGCPSFVDEPPGEEVLAPGALHDTRCYAENIAAWLAGRI